VIRRTLTLVETDLIRPSSTVVLVRARVSEPEIFMVRRHERSAFGSAHAFPGGVVDPEDSDVHAFCDGLSSAEANARLGVHDGGLDYYSSAIRELFEESGVLLADFSLLDENISAVREALNDGSVNWAEFVTRNELTLNCGELNYISHWVTPPNEPKRYSTRFFLSKLPEGQDAKHCGGELTESRWATASEVLAAERRGDVTLIFPTLKTLESLARHKSLDSLLEWAESSVEWGITSMVPLLIERDGKEEIVLPGDIDYPGATA
jgi:8-oxo-dGTP pyrophosphatase MutT (NUDIX family)